MLARNSGSIVVGMMAIIGKIRSGGILLDALDVRAELLEGEFHPFVAAVEVIDTVDRGFSACGEAGEDEAGRGAEVAGHDRRADEFANAVDDDA